MTSDQERLGQYVAAWKSTIDDTITLLRGLDEEDWAKPTDLPGWDVRAVAAHLAHLEAEIAGFEQTPVEVPELAHITSPMSIYTERGPIARVSWQPADIIDELERAAAVRFEALQQNPPMDGSADPPIVAGNSGGDCDWDWETLLRNRPLDVWMHEQDIRRAVGRPGGLDTPGAAHTMRVFTMSFPFCVGKRVAPPTGTTVVLDVSGVQPVHPVHLAVEVNDSGRAAPMTSEPVDPTVNLRMDLESFIILAGGRRTADELNVDVSGDRDLGRRILDAMAVTP